jgi:putative ABC transport system permease protein
MNKHGKRLLEDLDQEIREHIELETQDNISRGMSPDEARYAAMRKFGNVTRVKEDARGVWIPIWIEQFLQDIHYAFRLLRKSRAYTIVAVLTITLGIGATTAIFSIFYATLLAPFPYPKSDQLVVVWSAGNGHRRQVSTGDFLDWQRDSQVFQILGAVRGDEFNLSSSARPEQIEGSYLTPGFLDQLIGDKPFMGRYVLPEEAVPGKDHVVIITHKLWQRYFAGDPNILNKQVHLNGVPYTVIGVQPPGQPDRLGRQLVVPLAFTPEQMNHDVWWLVVLGRLKPGVTLAQANADLDRIARHDAELYPEDKGWGVSVEPLKNDFLDRDFQTGLKLLMGAVGFLLLIACANVANLLLARGTTRQREVAVRTSIGASRKQIFRQFLIESLVLASLGGILGVGLAWGLTKVILASMPPYMLLSEADVKMSTPVLLFTVAATMLSGVLFGCAPAWQASRLNLNEALKDGGGPVRGGGRQGLRRAFVIAEFALALSLLAGGGLAIHSFWNVEHVNLGFRSDHLFAFDLPVNHGKLNGAVEVNSFYRQVLGEINALPGVTHAAVSEGMPLRGVRFGMPFQIAGKEMDDMSRRPVTLFNMVTPQYFKVFEIQMLQGRSLNYQDEAGGLRVAVVDERFAKQFLSGMDPLSQRIVMNEIVPGTMKFGPPVEWQIVGVYRSMQNGRPEAQNLPEMNVPFWQSPWPQALITVRSSVEPAILTKSIGDVVQSIDPNLPLSNMETMDQSLERVAYGPRFLAFLFGGFAGIGMLLAAVGIYGVMSFAVVQRTHEIGVRMALGASRNSVLRMILKDGMVLALAGFLLGMLGAFGVGKVMHGILFDVAAFDYSAFGAVAGSLLLAGMLACVVPAHRATLVDPIKALRQE